MVCVDNISKLNKMLEPLTYERYLDPGHIQPDLFQYLTESVKSLNQSWETEFNTDGYHTPEISYVANRQWYEMAVIAAGFLSETLTELVKIAHERQFKSLSPTGSYANLYKAIEQAALAAAAMHSGSPKAPEMVTAGSDFKKTLMKITIDAEVQKHISEFYPQAEVIWSGNYMKLKPYCTECGFALPKGCTCSAKGVDGFLATLANFVAKRTR